MPDMDALPPGCEGVLVIQVFADATTRLVRYHAVNSQEFDLLLGSRDCDITIPLPGIGKRHARLVKTGDDMTLSDLGSGNATLVSGIACLPGEILYLENGDEIVLGDALVQISMIGKDRATP
jgi:pSer/pThr/pTyr-binding forkhead associated (FHA) protein